MPKKSEMKPSPENMGGINLSIYLKTLEGRVSRLEKKWESTLKILIEVKNLMKRIEKDRPKT